MFNFITLQKIILLVLIVTSHVSNANANAIEQSSQLIEKKSSTLETPISFRFDKIPAEQSKIEFNNQVVEDQVHNFFNFAYIYNGAGVAVGDINNDGLPDIYFSGNQVKNRLYLNEGDFSFRDITETAFATEDSGWKNGVTMIDINHDGLLDIYVSRSGLYQKASDRENRLYINQGDLTFTEEASKYNLNDPGFSIQAYFFDYDRDNDLDMFLINHRYDFENNNLVTPRKDIKYDRFSSDQLYRNNGDNTFSQVTQDSGIINYAWGLSAVINDFNNDGWDDIYVANDYVEPDNLYINNQDGTFTESIAKHMKHTSYYGMGSDLADINNDGLQDLIVLDMVPEDHVRAKRLMAPMSTENFWRLIDSGLHYQYMLNTLQLNQGQGVFSEIAQLSGVANTDWSWAPLFADFDHDGYSDLFITNGIKRDITDNDFFNRLNQQVQSNKPLAFNELIAEMPSAKLRNYLFHNQGNLTFKQVNEAGNMLDLTHSNGAAYADFDNDGDLDLVVNNLDSPALLYKNITSQPEKQHYIKIKLAGPKNNPQGIGAIVSITYGEKKQVKKLALSRGYLSSVEPLLHFGLADTDLIQTLSVRWSDGQTTMLNHIKANNTITVTYGDFSPAQTAKPVAPTLFKDISATMGVNYQHKENDYNDFAKEVLLPHKQSEHGPYISVADVNKDGLDDFYIGGSAGNSGTLFLQTQAQQFTESAYQPWKNDAESEDLGSLFFDFDNDGDLDLYVSSGGNEFLHQSELYRDRLYLNDGFGKFTITEGILPNIKTSGLRVVAGDYDNDGDLDLFIGGRIIPGQYPLSPSSYLLKNTESRFIDATDSIIPEIKKIGMVSDALFVDYDQDDDLDLILVGEWMPITIFENQQNHFINVTKQLGLTNTRGWWFALAQGDFDQDGDIDFVAGNLGQNNKYHPTTTKPLTLYANDFDQNGSLDIILAKQKNKRDLPIRGRQCSATQIPGLLSKFPTFQSFAEADMSTIYAADKLDSSQTFKAEVFNSSLIINNGTDGFEIRPLPVTAQISPTSGILVKDFNNDSYLDILYTGNFYAAEVETVRYDAGIGGLLLGDGKLGFNWLNPAQSGFLTTNNARDLKLIHTGKTGTNAALVTNNQGALQLFKWN